jgi:hypothetical protein
MPATDINRKSRHILSLLEFRIVDVGIAAIGNISFSFSIGLVAMIDSTVSVDLLRIIKFHEVSCALCFENDSYER